MQSKTLIFYWFFIGFIVLGVKVEYYVYKASLFCINEKVEFLMLSTSYRTSALFALFDYKTSYRSSEIFLFLL